MNVVDTSNPLLAPAQVVANTGVKTMGDGTRVGLFTLRTATTTLTIHLTGDDVGNWIEQLTALKGHLGGGITVVPAMPDILRGPVQNGPGILGTNGHRFPKQ